VGAAWSALNFLLIINLLKIAVLQKSNAKLTLILLIKFPLLYLFGYLILTKKLFSVSSLLCGLGSALLVLGAVNLWPRHK